MFSFQFEAIGTHWTIDVYDSIDTSQQTSIEKTILTRVEEFDKTYSRFRDDSWLRTKTLTRETVEAPSDFDTLFSLYQTLYATSGGLFTPLIGRVMEQAGYDKDYSLQAKKLTSPPQLEKAITFNKHKITFHEKVLLDFGAAGKGYLVDIIGSVLKKRAINNFCIDAGGDILYHTTDNSTIRIGLEHPDDPTIAIGVCELINKSICASAGNRRKWGNFHHTINPLTLTSPSEIKATWVVAETALLADALTTCLYLDPVPTRYKDFQFEYVLLYKDNKALRSNDFPGTLFT